MLERSAKLVMTQKSHDKCRRFLHSQLVGELLDCVDFGEQQYILIEDNRGSILGVLETEELLEKLASPDPVERRRWCEMPLESAINARLDTYASGRSGLPRLDKKETQEILGTTISTDEDEVAALYLGEELYLRWKSVKQLLQHALVDPVTTLPNRVVFERRLTEEWQRLERSSDYVTVVIIDLDYFKSVNDEHGHTVGDLVLKSIGRTLQQKLRSYDLLVRYGGDEFAAVLTGCPSSRLSIPIHRMQEGIRQMKVAGHENLPDFSLSIGAVTVRSRGQIESPQHLINEADACLYEAKDHGRDCAFIADFTSQDRRPKLIETPCVENMF